MEIDNIKVDILINEERKHHISWTDGYISTTGNNRYPESNQGCLGDVVQIQARVDLNILLRHRLRLFDMVIIPMMNDASGTWTLSKEHERMIQSTQRKMLRFIIQTRRTYTKKTQNNEVKVEEGVRKPETEKDGGEEKENHGSYENEK